MVRIEMRNSVIVYGRSMSYRGKNRRGGKEKEYEEKSSVGLDDNGSISKQQLTIDENLLVNPKLIFIGSKIGEGAHGRVYEGRSVWQCLRMYCIALNFLTFCFILFFFLI